MKRLLFLLFILTVGFSVNDVQKEHIVLNWKSANSLQVAKERGIPYCFEGASFADFNELLPVYLRIYNLENQNQEFRIVVENPTFREVEIPDGFNIPDEITNEIQVKSNKLQSGDNFKIQLKIIPFKREGEKLFLLKNFQLKKIIENVKSAKLQGFNWKTESVLKTGKWVKISVTKRGMYKIPYSKLTEWGFSNPDKVNVFGSGGVFLSENPGHINYDDLIQNAIWHGKNGGASCLFFYAEGAVEWNPNLLAGTFEHSRNEYTTKGFYFLTEEVGSERNVELLPAIEKPATHEISSVGATCLHESELENVLPHGSGKNWYGERYKNSTNKNFKFELKNIDVSKEIKVRISAIARSAQSSQMPVLINHTNVGALNFNRVNTGSQISTFADNSKKQFITKVQAASVTITTKYFSNNGGSVDDNASAWLDYIEVNYCQKLKVDDKPQFFYDINSVGTNNVVDFKITNASVTTKAFDVTDKNNIKEIPLILSGSEATVKRPADEFREYILVKTDGIFPEPELIGEIKNQNLHNLKTPEFLIIAHQNYLNAATDLANFHRTYDNMKVEVVDADKVYNEFSSGSKNATGIRNFIKMFYDRDDGLKYVLLFGDGSYDNRSIKPVTKSFIPTYQSENSLSPVGSFVTDDYFVILDANESVYDGAVDLGIGRIPANTVFAAELVVDKVKRYYSSAAMGSWRNVVCFIGDDQNDGQTMHMLDSEKLANYINKEHPEFITDKIYLDAFMQEITPAGERYPDATAAINKRVKDGVLILNYVGHANERFLADERVLDIGIINSWSNANYLPIFVTATCEFSRFDADVSSAGENILFNPNGGGIGLFSTTRVVFAYANFLLSKSFYNFVFKKDEDGNHYRMGDIMRLAKINTLSTTNKRNFTLLADPALKLSYPKHNVVTTKINGHNVENVKDTVRALQEVTISGFVADNSGNKLSSFSGEIIPIVYDKEILMSTLGNGGYAPIQFKVQENIIYKGLASVTNGEFAFSFVVPKDISYNLGEGKIIYYAKSGEVDAHGAFTNFVIGSSSDNFIADNKGPEIQLFMDSENFVSGGQTGRSPTMLASISDENGINTVGNGIGHDITAILDNDHSNVIVLNNFFQSNLDDFTSGKINFPFHNLTPGKHKLTLKAWDVANNSTEVEVEFVVSGKFYIEEITNYPNPLQGYTFFTFKHNQAGATLKTIIEIFDLSGRRIDYISQQVGSNGIESNPVRWDANEAKIPLRNGIYIYRVTAQNSDGVIAFKSGKLMIAQ
jgi:hypothetical protein